ncbi:hypothetical protein FB451DRAFT_1497571 [Mycena latifolia]|nr:hypothetical protein FB451DRAFT_1497571 [Mycena latifolia]
MAEHSGNPYLQPVAPGSPAFISPLSPNRAGREESSYSSEELKTLPTLPSHNSAPRLGYYPASLAALFIWIVFIILLVWLLESAVAHGPRSLSPPWAYSTLPGLLLTVFTQGHGALTAMHLARVSVSALHSPGTSPNSWAEVFWISDRAWQGPVGIFSTFLAASQLRVRTSTHFVLCAATCLTALATPVILSHSYPIRSILVDQDTTITPLALSVAQMGAIDAYAEIGTGVGSWSTALSVADVYNSSVYLPPGAARDDDPTDFFFAGDTDGKRATLPGLRLTGQCVPVDANFTDFTAFCTAQFGAPPQYMTGPVTLTPVSVNFTMNACTNRTWELIFPATSPAVSTNVAFISIASANTSVPDEPGISVSGIIRCDARTATGTAALSGDGTYEAFAEAPLYNATQAGEFLIDPLYALLYYFSTHATSLDGDDVYRAATVRALGFVGLSPGGGSQTYAQPSLEAMAAGFWRGVSCTVAGVALLARTNDTTYPAVQTGFAAMHVRQLRFALGAYALLGLWLCLLAVVTARSFRPTFSGSFDSYITAKLVLDKPGLVASASGQRAENTKLREPFGRVGMDDFGRVVVVEGQ